MGGVKKKKGLILTPGKLYKVKAPFEVLPADAKYMKAPGLALYKLVWLTIPGAILMYIKSEAFEKREEGGERSQLFFLDQKGKVIRTIPTSFFLFERRRNYQIYDTNKKEDFLEEVIYDKKEAPKKR